MLSSMQCFGSVKEAMLQNGEPYLIRAPGLHSHIVFQAYMHRHHESMQRLTGGGSKLCEKFALACGVRTENDVFRVRQLHIQYESCAPAITSDRASERAGCENLPQAKDARVLELHSVPHRLLHEHSATATCRANARFHLQRRGWHCPWEWLYLSQVPYNSYSARKCFSHTQDTPIKNCGG